MPKSNRRSTARSSGVLEEMTLDDVRAFKHKFAKFPLGKVKIPSLAHAANFIRPWHLYLPTSAGGETRTSTAEKGRILNEEMSKNLAQLLVELSKAKFNARFPYE